MSYVYNPPILKTPQIRLITTPGCTMREMTINSLRDFFFAFVPQSDANLHSVRILADSAIRTCAPKDVAGEPMRGQSCFNPFEADPPPCNGGPQPAIPDMAPNGGPAVPWILGLDHDQEAACWNPDHYPVAEPECTAQEIFQNAATNYFDSIIPQTDPNWDALMVMLDQVGETCPPINADGRRLSGWPYVIRMAGDPPSCP